MKIQYHLITCRLFCEHKKHFNLSPFHPRMLNMQHTILTKIARAKHSHIKKGHKYFGETQKWNSRICAADWWSWIWESLKIVDGKRLHRKFLDISNFYYFIICMNKKMLCVIHFLFNEYIILFYEWYSKAVDSRMIDWSTS